MANTRYSAMTALINADLRQEQGRTITTARMDAALSVALDWFYSLHPSHWPWLWVFTQTATSGVNESLSIQTDTGALGTMFTGMAPRMSSRWIVKSGVGTTSVAPTSWRPLKHKPWQTISQMSKWFNRTATTTNNQTYWSLKIDSTATATKRSVITLESFPYSYATGILWYQIDYPRITPTIASGSNADDALIHDETVYDCIVAYFAEALIAHELNDVIPGAFDRAWGIARELAHRALVNAGVGERTIKFEWISRKTSDDAEL